MDILLANFTSNKHNKCLLNIYHNELSLIFGDKKTHDS